MLPLLLSLATLTAAQDTSNTYLDARSRDLVQRARGRRELVDRSIIGYHTKAKERISLGLRTKLRERLFWRRETASEIDWRRGGPIDIKVLGAREVVPVASAKAAIPGDLKNFLPRLAFDPMESSVLVTLDTTGLRHPLSSGSEAHYQFRTGDSTTINLGERAIRLVELQVIPRRADIHLVTGSFWIDTDTHSVVQVVFRLAKDVDFTRDLDDDDPPDPPGFLKPLRGDLEYVTIRYGLIHLRWWMPTLFAAEGFVQAGPIRTPLTYERSYEDYQIRVDTAAAPITRAQLRENRPCQPPVSVNISVGTDSPRRPRSAEDSARSARRRAVQDSIRRAELERDTARARRAREAEECSQLYNVTVPDSTVLLTSPDLPPTIYGEKEELTSDPELKEIADKLRKLADPPWYMRAPTFSWGWAGNDLLRYNKIEALSVGARTEFDFGRLRADVTGRIGIADLEPNFELGLTRASTSSWIRAAAYRRLAVMDPAYANLNFASNLRALVLGRDDRDYYRTLGGELTIRPPEMDAQWFSVRLFGEAQKGVQNETDFSVRRLFDSGHLFEPNRVAARADQFGASLTLRTTHGQDPDGLRFGGELTIEGSTGTYDFTRESLALQLGFPLPGKFAGAVEVTGGTTTSDGSTVPIQGQWFLGGARTMRGYRIGERVGTAFWRARGEVGRGLPLARVVLFSDLGWAGDRSDLQTHPSLMSAGLGGSFLDGLVRLDLARALRGPTAWRFYVSVDGIL